jgi:pectinesterase
MLLRVSLLACLACLTHARSADERIVPSSGSLVVDASGKLPNSYLNISAAVTALVNNTDVKTIYIAPGIYPEQVYIPPLAGPLIVQGYTTNARSYKDNQVTITGNLSRTNPSITNNDATATVRLWTSNVKFYNLNIANTFGQAATLGQALALSAQNTNQGFYSCKFSGYQDTIYANLGRQVYANTLISGAVDFVFGQRASVWLEKVDIQTIGKGYITANGRDAENNTSIFVFNKATVGGTSGANSTYLGRPWRQWSRVIFQESYLGDVVRPEGWAVWDAVQPLDHVVYQEYKNDGPGAAGTRANFSSKLTKPIKIQSVFGTGFEKEFWVDASYL